MMELRVVGLRVELPVNTPLVLLKETEGERYLPIWIGAPEASAIAHQQQGVQHPRPMTHDLLRDVISALGGELESVLITEMRDNTYFAELVFAGGLRVSARPSDAIALALRTEAKIYGEEEMLDAVGVLIPDAPEERQEDQVEKFREFLDQVSPEDFAGS